jgi:ribose 5-phosphate isomerase B
MKIYISSDHGGFELKNKLREELWSLGHELHDLGPDKLNPDDDYPDYAFNLAEKVVSNPDSIGILICRSGNGMAIAANKVKGARAALCFTLKHAEMARRDDAANILCLDSDYEDKFSPIEITKAFLEYGFEGWDTRHGRRVKKILDYESKNFFSLIKKAIKGK